MSKIVYISKSSIERRRGPLRIAHLPGEPQPVVYSVHGAIAKNYKVDSARLNESHASTIDYVISATAGSMLGTFGGALEAHQIAASNGKLTGDVTGEVEEEDGVLVIRRIQSQSSHASGMVRACSKGTEFRISAPVRIKSVSGSPDTAVYRLSNDLALVARFVS